MTTLARSVVGDMVTSHKAQASTTRSACRARLCCGKGRVACCHRVECQRPGPRAGTWGSPTMWGQGQAAGGNCPPRHPVVGRCFDIEQRRVRPPSQPNSRTRTRLAGAAVHALSRIRNSPHRRRQRAHWRTHPQPGAVHPPPARQPLRPAPPRSCPRPPTARRTAGRQSTPLSVPARIRHSHADALSRRSPWCGRPSRCVSGSAMSRSPPRACQ